VVHFLDTYKVERVPRYKKKCVCLLFCLVNLKLIITVLFVFDL